MSKYAIVQANITCFGLGETLEQAYGQAFEFIDPAISLENISVIKHCSEFDDACMNGELIGAKCSDEYFDAASLDPTVKFKWDFDQITIDTDN
jgi:hypothetical protein